MKAWDRLRAALERVRKEAIRANARRKGQADGVREAYEFDIREKDVPGSAEWEKPEREAIVSSAAALSYREAHVTRRRQNLITRLHDQDSLRDAVLLSEILRKPVSLRGRR